MSATDRPAITDILTRTELAYLRQSDSLQTVFAENYVGLPLQ